MRAKAAAAVNKYWRSGFVSALVMFDGLVLVVCLIDVSRFARYGLPFQGVLSAAVDNALHDYGLPLLVLSVFLFFLIGMPALIALLCSFWPSDRWPRGLGAKSKAISGMHVCLSLTIACFTAAAVMMEVLSGWSNVVEDDQSHILQYSFFSFWLFAVFSLKFISVAYLSPILKKIFWRVSVEHHGKGSGIATEVVKEVLTEHEH